MTDIVIDIRAEALLARIQGAAAVMEQRLTRAVTRLSIEVQAAVKEQKLTGQVLHVRTGTLRRSINRRVTQIPQGTFASVGTNVSYARVHEFGFRGNVSVRARTRKVKSAFGKPLRAAALQNVRAHSRRVDLPARSFLRSTLREQEPRIVSSLRDAVLGALVDRPAP